MSDAKSTTPVLLVLLVVVGVAVVLAAVVPRMNDRSRAAPEAHALGLLKTISTAQMLFREKSAESGNTFAYGTLTELSEQMLVDEFLGSGTKYGYIFATAPGTAAPEFVFWATATPGKDLKAKYSYVRSFFTNHHGVTYYTTARVVAPITSECAVPPGWVEVGK